MVSTPVPMPLNPQKSDSIIAQRNKQNLLSCLSAIFANTKTVIIHNIYSIISPYLDIYLVKNGSSLLDDIYSNRDALNFIK